MALCCKHLLLAALSNLMEHSSRDVIPVTTLEDAEREGLQAMDAALQRDSHTIWRTQLTAEEGQPRFQLPPVIRPTFEERRDAAAPDPEPKPRSP